MKDILLLLLGEARKYWVFRKEITETYKSSRRRKGFSKRMEYNYGGED